MNDLTTKNELLDRAAQLNQITEQSFFSLSVTLAEIEETGAYKEAGYESYAEYVAGDLQRSKSTASKLLKVGKWIKASGFLPETIETSYPRLYSAMNALPEAAPEEVLAHATTLSESEIITTKHEKAFPNCQHPTHICKDCRAILNG